MQITIVQAEIEAAITAYVLSQLAVKENQEVSIELRATRGDTGMQAIIDIVPSKKGGQARSAAKAPQAVQAAPTASSNPPLQPTSRQHITTADLKRMHAETAAREEAALAEDQTQGQENGHETVPGGGGDEALTGGEDAEQPQEETPPEPVEDVPPPSPPAPPTPPVTSAKASTPPKGIPGLVRPPSQVSGAAPAAPAGGAPPKKLFAGFARPSNNPS